MYDRLFIILALIVAWAYLSHIPPDRLANFEVKPPVIVQRPVMRVRNLPQTIWPDAQTQNGISPYDPTRVIYRYPYSKNTRI